MNETHILISLLWMYFPWNWEFGSALSTPTPSVRHCHQNHLGNNFLYSQVAFYFQHVQWNLSSRTPLFTNNSVHEQIFRAKKSRMTNGVSDYKHASWQQRQAESIGAGVSVAG
jgi:hypothetical protein